MSPSRDPNLVAPLPTAASSRWGEGGQRPGEGRSRDTPVETGFTLAALIVILTIISIVVAYTVPQQWSLVLKRDRDRQTIFLMKQYARGILNWQTKHNATLPVSLEQLQEARQPRMLRGNGKWRCPITGNEDDWIMVPPQALQPNIPGVPPNLNSGGRLRTDQPVPVPIPVPQGTYVPSKLNKELSPPDYSGPFVAVRPKASGKSFIALNGAEDYSEWVFTVDDLRNEITQRQSLITPVTTP